MNSFQMFLLNAEIDTQTPKSVTPVWSLTGTLPRGRGSYIYELYIYMSYIVRLLIQYKDGAPLWFVSFHQIRKVVTENEEVVRRNDMLRLEWGQPDKCVGWFEQCTGLLSNEMEVNEMHNWYCRTVSDNQIIDISICCQKAFWYVAWAEHIYWNSNKSVHCKVEFVFTGALQWRI